MPAVQTTYNQTLSPAVAGMTVNMELQNMVSRAVQAVTGTANGLAFGVAVRRGTTDMSIQDASAATPFFGITALDPTVRPAFNGVGVTADHYQQNHVAAVMLKGVIWVVAGAAVTATSTPAYFDANGNITPTTTGNTAIPNGTFDSTAGSGALVKLRLS